MSSEWEKFRREQERLRQEAEAQARERERQRLLDEQRRINASEAERQRLERLRRREIEKGQESVRQLEQEARTVYPIYDIAESIRSRWTQQGADVQVKQIQSAYVELNDDGTVKRDRSSVGVRLSYSYQDVQSGQKERAVDDNGTIYYETYYYPGRDTEELSFGIGYFGVENDRYYGLNRDRSFSSEIEMPFSAEEKQKGVKAYFVEGIVIPIGHPESKNKFFSVLAAFENYFNPEKYLPSAARSLREHGFSETPPQPQTQPPQKPGFLRRMFRRG